MEASREHGEENDDRNPGIYVPAHSLNDADKADLFASMPFVLTNQTADRGHGTYLIESEPQLERVLAFIKENRSLRYEDDLSARRYIDTGICTGSFRIITTSWGHPLHVSVFGSYRADQGTIVRDRFDGVTSDPKLLYMKHAFEIRSRYSYAMSRPASST